MTDATHAPTPGAAERLAALHARLRTRLREVEQAALPLWPVTFMHWRGPGDDFAIRWIVGEGFRLNRATLGDATPAHLVRLARELPRVVAQATHAIESEVRRVEDACREAEDVLAILRAVQP